MVYGYDQQQPPPQQTYPPPQQTYPPPQQGYPPPQQQGYPPSQQQGYPPTTYQQGYPPPPQQPYSPNFQGYVPPQPQPTSYTNPPVYNTYQPNPQPQVYSFSQSSAAVAGGEERAPSYSNDDGKFPDTTAYRDLLFAVLFVVHLIAVFVILGTGAARLPKSKNNYNSDEYVFVPFYELYRVIGVCVSPHLDDHVKLIGAAVAFVFAFLWLQVMKKFARQLIYFTLIASVIFWLIIAVISFIYGSVVYGFILLICAAFNAMMYFFWRSKIPFATAMLQTVSGLLNNYPAPSHFAYGSLVVQILWVVLWVPTFAIVQEYESSAGVVLSVFLILSFYWTSQVVKNVVHVTASGMFATWYFLSGVGMPSNPTLKSFKRATTTSFGSICLGSLLVAILKTLRQLVNVSRGKDMYAFTQVAIYGKPYCQAAKDTWRLIKTHGVDAIVNDNLISGVLLMGSIMGGIVSAIVGGIIGYLWLQPYWVALAIVCFLIGVSLVMLTMEVVESGVATIFVCFAMVCYCNSRTKY